jgi:hypothetical protein
MVFSDFVLLQYEHHGHNDMNPANFEKFQESQETGVKRVRSREIIMKYGMHPSII